MEVENMALQDESSSPKWSLSTEPWLSEKESSQWIWSFHQSPQILKCQGILKPVVHWLPQKELADRRSHAPYTLVKTKITFILEMFFSGAISVLGRGLRALGTDFWACSIRKMQQLLLFLNRHRHPRGIGHGSRLRGGVQLIKKGNGPNETA